MNPGGLKRLLEIQSLVSMGRTSPNPSVACVLLCKYNSGEIRQYYGNTEISGKRHAEIVALDNYDASGERARKIILLVTLEPCSVTGKTPPCTDRILKYPEIKTIVIFSKDPSLLKSGINALRKSGKKVIILKDSVIEKTFLNGFTGRISTSGPRMHLKAASDSRGLIGRKGERLFLSSPDAYKFSMALRAKLDAVLAGPGTVASDLPGLEMRQMSGELFFRKISGNDLFTELMLENYSMIEEQFSDRDYQPRRIFILGKQFENSSVFIKKQEEISRITGKQAVYFLLEDSSHLWGTLSDVEIIPSLASPDFSSELRKSLAGRGLNEVLIEGGAGLFLSLEKNLTDRDRIYILKSKKNYGILKNSNDDVYLPAFMEKRQKRAFYDLGGDFLNVY